jgi:very-short-patch-repair endonuclease
VVEVDGEHHGDQLAYDRRRDRLMASMGYRVLRFWVNEIDDSMEAVLEAIHQAVMAPSSRESTSSGEP